MSRGIILYQSKYGATKKYVDWLVEELGYDYVETKDAKVANLLNYDVIILGGGVYASGIAGLQFLKKNMFHCLQQSMRSTKKPKTKNILV